MDNVPTPTTIDPDDPIRPRVLVLPASRLEAVDERERWLDDRTVTAAYRIDGGDSPLFWTDADVAVTTTGIGKADAATTVATMCANPGLDLSDATILTVGIAGGSPERAPLGSVFVADAVVDWDCKHRWDRDASLNADRPAIDVLAYRPREYYHRLNEDLVDRALTAVEGVELHDDPAVREIQRTYPTARETGPIVERGTTVCGDEYWHGGQYAKEVDWLCAQYDLDPYCTTQMEDAATAAALDRFGHLERYLSVRAVANYDRPAPGQPVEESFDGTTESLEQGLENAYRVGSAIIEDLLGG